MRKVDETADVLAGAAGRIEPVHLQLPEPTPSESGRELLSGPADTVPPTPFGAGTLPGTYPPPPPMMAPMPAAPPPGSANDLRAQRESWEKQQILGALEKTSGNQKEAAKLLGVSRRTLINKIEAYGIARPRKR